jgi:hypothetical protein
VTRDVKRGRGNGKGRDLYGGGGGREQSSSVLTEAGERNRQGSRGFQALSLLRRGEAEGREEWGRSKKTGPGYLAQLEGTI